MQLVPIPILTSVDGVTTDRPPKATRATSANARDQAGDSSRSVYQRALGADFSALDPRLQKYFGPIPRGWVGHGSGVYSVAGSRYRLLRPALALFAWRHTLFPEFGRNVPFAITNTPGTDGSLSAVRTFRFSHRTRVMEDTMTVLNGEIHDRLGKRRGLDVTIQLSVAAGGLRMTSTGLAIHLGRIRIPLPPAATMTLDERTDPTDPTRQHVDVRITTPILREVFRYIGTFTYQLVRA